MDKLIASIAAAAALAALSAAPSLADARATTATYHTSLVQTGVLAAPGAYEGTLQLTTSSDGIVSGWYTPQDSGTPLAVTGGLSNGAMWLDIGDNGELHVNAAVENGGALTGTATELPGFVTIAGTIGARTYDFAAAPVSNG